MSRHAVLCRFGEIFLKKGNRPAFIKRLADNMQRAVAPFGARVERGHGRILVWLPAPSGPGSEGGGNDPEPALTALSRVFGLTSLSPVLVVERDLGAITQAAIAETQAAIAAWPAKSPPSFKVEARRADKRFLPASPELARQVGGAVFQATGLRVDVHQPDLLIGIEIGYEHAFVYARVIPAPGGLPVGATGKADLLLSGGIDSPVAGWMSMKRGCHLAATYFHSFPYTGDRTKEKVKGLASLLARWQGDLELRVVPFTAAQKALRDAGEPRLAVVLYRRMMMRVATHLARERGALALVTGEALAQVASQTLENLTAIEAAAGLLVLRPLIAHDKVETVALARRIGTYDRSIEPYEDSCSMFVPEHPEIRARLADVEAVEQRVDIAQLVEDCVRGTERIRCKPGE